MRPYEALCVANPRVPADVVKMKADPRYPAFLKALAENPVLQKFQDSGALRTWFSAKKKYPDATWADASYVYKTNFAVDSPWNGDTFQFGFDAIPGYAHHNIDIDTDRVPEFYHAMPDTDYEFSAYQCTDGAAELWRILAPGIPRGHHFPRQPRAKFRMSRGRKAVTSAKTIVKPRGQDHGLRNSHPLERDEGVEANPRPDIRLHLPREQQQRPDDFLWSREERDEIQRVVTTSLLGQQAKLRGEVGIGGMKSRDAKP